MLDSDLAKLYKVETKRINELVLKDSKRIDLLEKKFFINKIEDNIIIKKINEEIEKIIL